MSFLFRSQRIGKGGRAFTMYKVRTLVEANNTQYAHENGYTWCGRFLRKYRLDEIPQIWNLVKGDMRVVGIRPLEEKTFNLYPEHIREQLVSIKPGWFSLSGIFFIDEEHLLSLSEEPAKDYWERIVPLKLALDFFYLENRCISLDIWIVWQGFKKAIKQIWK